MGSALRRVSLREQALDVVRQALVSGEIKPGDIYSAAALAERLGVSNSPVREAMLTLVHEGLLEAVPNRGFRGFRCPTPISTRSTSYGCCARFLPWSSSPNAESPPSASG